MLKVFHFWKLHMTCFNLHHTSSFINRDTSLHLLQIKKKKESFIDKKNNLIIQRSTISSIVDDKKDLFYDYVFVIILE